VVEVHRAPRLVAEAEVGIQRRGHVCSFVEGFPRTI
jgi:hypothetical protein